MVGQYLTPCNGGTIAGLALGSRLSSLNTKVHAFSVCDDPEYFYDYAKGLGYAMNTAEELKFVKDIAAATGIVLDAIYSGKAVYGLLKYMAGNPAKWKGRMDLEDSVPCKDGTGCSGQRKLVP